MIGARSDCNKHIPHRYHYTYKKGHPKPKKPFGSEDEADEYIKHYKLTRYKSYICPQCGAWHIGFLKESD